MPSEDVDAVEGNQGPLAPTASRERDYGGAEELGEKRISHASKKEVSVVLGHQEEMSPQDVW